MKIFINYRRDDVQKEALNIATALMNHFNPANVFVDRQGMEPGQNFEHSINQALKNCNIFIPIIGKNWLKILNERRALEEKDYVLEELKFALEKGIKIIPVLLDDVEMPKQKDLPDFLSGFTYIQAFDLSSDPKRNHRDINYLAEVIKKNLLSQQKNQKSKSRNNFLKTYSKPIVGVILLMVLMLAINSNYFNKILSNNKSDKSEIDANNFDSKISNTLSDNASKNKDQSANIDYLGPSHKRGNGHINNHYVKEEKNLSIQLKGRILTNSGSEYSFTGLENKFPSADIDIIHLTTGIDGNLYKLPEIELYLHYIKKLEFLDELQTNFLNSKGESSICTWRKAKVHLIGGEVLSLYQSLNRSHKCNYSGLPREKTLIDSQIKRKITEPEIKEIFVDQNKENFQPVPSFRGGSYAGSLNLKNGDKFNFSQFKAYSKNYLRLVEGKPNSDEISFDSQININISDIKKIKFLDVVSFNGVKNQCFWIKSIISLKDKSEPKIFYFESNKQWVMANDCGPNSERLFTFIGKGFVLKSIRSDIISEINFN